MLSSPQPRYLLGGSGCLLRNEADLRHEGASSGDDSVSVVSGDDGLPRGGLPSVLAISGDAGGLSVVNDDEWVIGLNNISKTIKYTYFFIFIIFDTKIEICCPNPKAVWS